MAIENGEPKASLPANASEPKPSQGITTSEAGPFPDTGPEAGPSEEWAGWELPDACVIVADFVNK